MRFLKIMGIFTSILSLLSCGHGNKRVTQNDGINSNIPVAARITIDKLPDVLRNVQAGNTDYDFIVPYRSNLYETAIDTCNALADFLIQHCGF